jgi:dTDP-4-dehydrorhamnose reductase
MRILILGGSGMLGHKLLLGLRAAGHYVSCTLRDDRSSSGLARLPLFAGPDVFWGIDVIDWPSLRTLLRAHQPDVVINAVGIIKQRQLATSAIPSIQINALLPHQLAETVAAWSGRLIHFSSDCVFSGDRGDYTESDNCDADDLYGRSKFLGEVIGASNVVTLRSSIIGRELHHHQSLLDWFLSQNHREVKGFTRVIYAGLTTNEFVTVVNRIITQHPELAGLFQVASDPISKHDLLQMVANAFRLDVRIVPTDEPFSDRSFSGAKFTAATGYVAPPWPDLVAALASDQTPYREWLELIAGKPR